MNVEPASAVVERELPEFAPQVGLHVEQLEPEHLGVDRDWVIGSTSGSSEQPTCANDYDGQGRSRHALFRG
jgi:hypothetical protein